MTPLSDHHILILGWPTAQREWITNYPNVTASRIYREKISALDKRRKNLSFHTPRSLWSIESLSPRYWYEDWKNAIESYDTVILIDEIRGRDVFEYILEKNPTCRLCVFFDSPITPGSKKDPSNYKDLPVHFFTCDRKIASKYHITFAPYFYIFSPYPFEYYEHRSEDNILQDVFFVGEEKGDRAERITEIKQALDTAGLTYEIHLIPQKRHGRSGAKASYLPYDEVIERIKSSRAILELISDGQTGITQRPYEALFFKKKLITTSREIMNYDFYHPENVFILGERPVEELPAFLQSPTAPVAPEIIEQYTITHWLKQFL